MNGHDVAVEFNKALLVLNRARLYIDAEEVDRENVLYGDKEPESALPDGTAVVVSIESGMIGELTKAQLRSPTGRGSTSRTAGPRTTDRQSHRAD